MAAESLILKQGQHVSLICSTCLSFYYELTLANVAVLFAISSVCSICKQTDMQETCSGAWDHIFFFVSQMLKAIDNLFCFTQHIALYMFILVYPYVDALGIS